MAKDKKGFVLYADMKSTFDKLPNEKAGELIKHIFSYVNDENPEPNDLIIEIAFEPIKQQLKRDLKKYEQTCSKNRENINKRWNKEDTTVYDRIPTDTKHTDKDNDKVIDKDIKKKEDPFQIKFDNFISGFNKLTGRNFKGDTKTRRQLKDRLKEGYTGADFSRAIKALYADDFHKENGFKFATPEFITRADKLEMYVNKEENKIESDNVYPGKIGKRDKFEPDLLKEITKQTKP